MFFLKLSFMLGTYFLLKFSIFFVFVQGYIQISTVRLLT